MRRAGSGAERQILAALEHPNIARLLDGGAADDGQPYFVMEYVDGRAHRRVRPRAPTAGRRAAPALAPGAAARCSYAHQHLVVHRDIKPANVLVTADGTPKLLDFGIAKLLDPDAEAALAPIDRAAACSRPSTRAPSRSRAGTSPRRATSTRWACVLYELLTGRSPYRPRSRAPGDIAEAIRTTEPVRPSAAVSGADASLGRRLRGDLDTIVLTALRKEPERRYPSVEQLAGDVRRHLEGLPVRARPDTFGYRAGKFIRRHRAGVAAAALVSLALVAGTVATAWQARAGAGGAGQGGAPVQRRPRARARGAVRLPRRDQGPAGLDAGAGAAGARCARATSTPWPRSPTATARSSASWPRAYERVGDVQGGNLSGNLGDTQGALESYGKAVRILETLFAADSNDAQTRRDLARTAVARGRYCGSTPATSPGAWRSPGGPSRC